MNKYQLKITPDELSIKPYFGYRSKVKWSAVLSVLIFGILPFSGKWLSYDVRSVFYAIGCVAVFYAVYDFLFYVNVKFLFDKKSKAIYKINIPFFKKYLMAFEEMTIINISECGAIEYAIGRKKRQFIKNYSISDTFTNSKKSQVREAEYVKEVLDPILEFIKA